METQRLTSDRLIIFTRYPEPGKAKTRLIPALGAEGAAHLHRHMAEHCLQQARSLQSVRPIELEIRFAGGTPAQMTTWLGADLSYQPQGEGDLGDRMARAFQTGFDAGRKSIVLIGTDCPDLDTYLLEQAFRELQQHDLVLGRATDGGYYLIGLRHPVPELFQGIRWSTSEVLAQTVEIAERLGLTIAYLPMLSDVDRPEDLPIWEKRASIDRSAGTAAARISVIIPVLNEAAHLTQTLATVQTASDLEIIVVDGGSQDSTVQIAESASARVIASAPGRARQMNTGARIASGDVLLFLHGDTRLPPKFDRLIEETLSEPGVLAGAFDLRIDGQQLGLRWVEWAVKWRSRLLQMPYGDQALFMKTKVFRAIGGFTELPIMEDFEILQRLKRLGKIAIVPVPVLTSGRRWQKLGIWQTTLINQSVIMAYFLGVAPDRLARWYRREGKRGGKKE